MDGDLPWRLTGLFFSFCLSCYYEVQFPEPELLLCSSALSEGGAETNLFKFSSVFLRDGDNSPSAEAYFASLMLVFEQFPFFLPSLRVRFQRALFSRRFNHVKPTGAELQSEACE